MMVSSLVLTFLNEAFLERFPITFEQKYPSVNIEKKILANILNNAGKSDDEFATKLTTADVIRKTYFEGGVDEIISTRRLVHIVQAYIIFNNRLKSIELCTNRFDDDTKNSFVDLYTKVDSGASAEDIIASQNSSELTENAEDTEQIVVTLSKRIVHSVVSVLSLCYYFCYFFFSYLE